MKKILIVDDEAEFRELMSDYLAFRFHHMTLKIELVADGLQALEKLKQNNGYDLLITDVKMPKMDGHQLLAEIHKLAEGQRPTYILIASGHADLPVVSPGEHVKFMEKPIELSALGRFVDCALCISEESGTVAKNLTAIGQA